MNPINNSGTLARPDWSQANLASIAKDHEVDRLKAQHAEKVCVWDTVRGLGGNRAGAQEYEAALDKLGNLLEAAGQAESPDGKRLSDGERAEIQRQTAEVNRVHAVMVGAAPSQPPPKYTNAQLSAHLEEISRALNRVV